MSKNLVADPKRKAKSSQFYKELMSGFSFKPRSSMSMGRGGNRGSGRMQPKIKPSENIFNLPTITEEVKILTNEKSMSEKLAYNKYYWNLVCLTQVLKTFPEDKEGNFAHNMKKKDIQKHFKESAKLYTEIASRMENLFSVNFVKLEKKGKTVKAEKKVNVRSRNQFDNFVNMNYQYAEWANANKRAKELKDDKKWLKTLRGGGMDEYFKQKLCEAHFKKVFKDQHYPIQKFLRSLSAHLHKAFGDMAKGIFCNVEKLVEDINGLPDLIINRIIEGYRTQLKSVDKNNFPLNVMRDMISVAILNNNGRDIIPLFRKFINSKTEEKLDVLRKFMVLDRMPLQDPRLLLPEEKTPYASAIAKFSEISGTLEVKEQLKIIDLTFQEIFKCVDRYYGTRDKNLVGMKIKDTDLSFLILYVILNCDIFGISSWMQYIKEFKDKKNRMAYRLFEMVVNWVDDIKILKENSGGKDGGGEKDGGSNDVEEVESRRKSVRKDSNTPTPTPKIVKAKVTKSFSNQMGLGGNQQRSTRTVFGSAEEKDEKMLEMEASLEDKSLLMSFLKKRIFERINGVRESLDLPPLERKFETDV